MLYSSLPPYSVIHHFNGNQKKQYRVGGKLKTMENEEKKKKPECKVNTITEYIKAMFSLQSNEI